MTKVLIFGANAETGRVLHELLRRSDIEVLGVVCDDVPATPGVAVWSPTAAAPDVPLLSREDALRRFAPADVQAFVCGTSWHLNQDRLSAYMAVKQLGYRVMAVAGGTASIAADVRLRDNVFVDHGARVLGGANIGANSWIFGHAEIGQHARLGSSCWIGSRCVILDGAVLGKNCTLAPGVVVGPGVTLPAWSTINQAVAIDVSPATAIFIDPLFRARVTLHR